MIQQSDASFTIYTSVLTGIFLVSLPQHTEVVGSNLRANHNEFFHQDILCSFPLCCSGLYSPQKNGLHGNLQVCILPSLFFFATLIFVFRECKERYGIKPKIECT